MYDDEICLLRKQRPIPRPCRSLKNEFQEGGGRKPRAGEQNRFRFGQVDLSEQRIQCGLKELL